MLRHAPIVVHVGGEEQLCSHIADLLHYLGRGGVVCYVIRAIGDELIVEQSLLLFSTESPHSNQIEVVHPPDVGDLCPEPSLATNSHHPIAILLLDQLLAASSHA